VPIGASPWVGSVEFHAECKLNRKVLMSGSTVNVLRFLSMSNKRLQRKCDSKNQKQRASFPLNLPKLFLIQVQIIAPQLNDSFLNGHSQVDMAKHRIVVIIYDRVLTLVVLQIQTVDLRCSISVLRSPSFGIRLHGVKTIFGSLYSFS